MPPKKKIVKKRAKASRLPKKGEVHVSKTRKTKPTSKGVETILQAGTPPKPKEQIAINAAKGRPMLTWVGKRPLRSVTPFPAQHVESFTAPGTYRELTQNAETWKEWPIRYPQGGLLFHGDNKEVLAHLLANGFRGKVQLIYIDPPFDSGADYVRKVSLRGTKGSAKIAGESYSLGEQVQYTDIWTNDNYLQFMYERLLLLKSLLGENGSLFLHCDWKRTHLLRLLLDEVFGPEGFKNEVIRVKCNPKNSKRKAFGNIHDCIIFYTNGNDEGRTWQPQREGIDSEDLERLFSNTDAKSQRKYTTVALHARGTRSPDKDSGKPWRGLKPPQGRHWAYLHSQLDQFDADGLIEWSSTGNPRLIRYADEKDGDLVQDIWTMKDPEEDEYPTEKPEDLLDRIIRGTTKQGDIVLDCFLGSGTTAAVAQKLGRRWMGCDINKGAVQTAAKRIQTIIHDQIEKEKHALSRTASLPGMEADGEEEELKPVQFDFTIWRVNDYDLAIQHNEAVNLACEHIGVTRTLSDSFFDGTLGQKLVKIIPFGHPLSLTDLEDVRVKIESRPNDSRDVVVVCLGKELGVEAWLANWNRMRKQGNTPNKIEVIELRTDPKYGKFFAHKPAQVRVKVRRADGKLTIEVQDFISPSILERLQEQAGPLLAPKVTDWRAMVDSVMIDPAYDGKVFNITLADVPERKRDLVQGRYELSAPKGKTLVAVKVTDMLGEEVLVQQEV